MKLASYVADGKACFGVVTGDGVVTLNQRLGYANLRDALTAGGLAEIRKAADTAKPDHKQADVKWLPVIPNPEKILCAGINYRSHAAEMIRPAVSQSFDFEGELAVVIARGGRHIPVERALDHVAGYTCFVDGSVRDYQKFSVTSGKNFPATGPLGPWIVTADEITDPGRLVLTTRLNGQEVQKSATDLLIYSVPQIIAFCSQFTPLAPGDVIATGTPEGVGHRRNPPLWMKPGDVLEVEISGIGTLRNRVVDEKA